MAKMFLQEFFLLIDWISDVIRVLIFCITALSHCCDCLCLLCSRQAVSLTLLGNLQ